MEEPSKAVVVQQPPSRGPHPNEWVALKESAIYAFKSGLLPQSIRSPEQAVTIALMGKEIGLGVMTSLTGIYVVNGAPILKSATMLRLIYERVPGAKITVVTPPDDAMKECEVEMKRPGGEPQRFKYTIAEAQKAGFLSKKPWQDHPATMLRWAAIRTGARIVFADAIAGCYMEDEIDDGKSSDRGNVLSRMQKNEVENGGRASANGSVQATSNITESDYRSLQELAKNRGFTGDEFRQSMQNITGKISGRELVYDELQRLKTHFEKAPLPPKKEESRPPENQAQGIDDDGLISQKQIARLYAVANESNWTNDNIHEYLMTTWKLDSVKKIHWKDYEQIVKAITDNPLHKEESDFAEPEDPQINF